MFLKGIFSRFLMTLFVLAHAWTGAALAGPKLRTPLVISVTAKVPFSFDLRNYLIDPGTPGVNPQYTWDDHGGPPVTVPPTHTLAAIPGNVSIDSPNNILAGTINTPGEYDFKLGVRDSTTEVGDTFHPAKFIVLPPPPQFNVKDINLGIQSERVYWEDNIKRFLVDPSLAQSFTVKNLPTWMTFENATGKIYGTPQRQNVGPYSNIEFTVIGQAGTDTAIAHGAVQQVPIPPKWIASSIDLPEVDEEQPMSANTLQFVLNPENYPLEFQIVDIIPKPWMQIGKTTGTLYGTPPDPMNVEVKVSFSVPGEPYTDTTIFKFKVRKVNHKPQWKGNPIVLQNCFTGINCKAELAQSVVDPDGDTLTYSITPPNTWMSLNTSTGTIQGIPGKVNVGLNKWTVTATDPGGLSDTTVVEVTVIKSNEPPTWNAHPTILVDAYEDKPYEVDLTPFATDPDGDPMVFTIIEDPLQGPWAKISGDKVLTGTPRAAQVGLNRFRIRVADNKSVPADVADVLVMVHHTNHPPYWTLTPIGKSHPEESPLTLDLRPYAKDDDFGDTLTFSKGDGAWPSWVEITPDGFLKGVPMSGNVGLNVFNVRVSDNSGAFADNRIEIDVKHVNHPPKWTANPLVLPNAKESAAYSQDLNTYVTDADLPNDQLRFVKVSTTPAWVIIDSNGQLRGTPGPADAGKTQSFQVRVLDLANADAVTTVTITVEKTNHPPEWLANPITLTNGYEGKPYKFELKDFARDPDQGDTLTFSLGAGAPTWVTVGPNGTLTANPPQNGAGDYELSLVVADQLGLSATTRGLLKILPTPLPPVVGNLPTFTVKIRETLEDELTKWVTDPKGQTLNFNLVPTAGCEGWVALSSTGHLTLTPQRAQLGYHECNFKVNNSQLVSFGLIKIQVVPNPRPPVWLTEPITENPLVAKTNVSFSGNVANRAKDLDALPLTFSREPGGKAWLNIDAAGNLSGVPTDLDLGENRFTLVVCNTDKLCSKGTLIINVELGMVTDAVQVDKKVAGAPAENLWILDNSLVCNNTMNALKKHIGVFYNELKAAEINFATVVMSSDAEKFNGEPVEAPGEKYLLKWDHTSWVNSFRERVSAAYSNLACNNCRNSPIWSKFLFNDHLPNISELYHNGYVMPGVPMDVMMVSHQMDHYKYYTKKMQPPVKQYEANDFLRDYLAFYKKETKLLRVNAIAPECQQSGGLPSGLWETSGDPTSVGAPNSYRIIVDGTNGEYFPNKCNFESIAAETLRKYAAQIIFRAYVHAKTRIALSKMPMDPSTIVVKIGGTTLTGDKWRYDATRNEVELYWHLIDLGGNITPGMAIEISYRVS